LQFFAGFVIQLVGKEAMDAPHVADGSNEDIQKDRRKRSARRHPRVPLENLFMMEIHDRSKRAVYHFVNSVPFCG